VKRPGQGLLGRTRLTIFDAVNYLVISAIIFITMFPLLNIVSVSFSSPADILGNRIILFPRHFTLDAYRLVFVRIPLLQAFLNTIEYTTVGTLFSVISTLLMAYPLSRRTLYGRGVLMFVVSFTMFFSGGMIPTFILVRRLGIIDTLWAIVLPGLVSTWNLIITRTYFQGLPVELNEAAKIDGASEYRIFATIIIPLSKAIIAVLVLYYAVEIWNYFFIPMLYLNDPRKFPLQLLLRGLLVDTGTSQTDRLYQGKQVVEQSIKFAAVTISTLPIIAIYPFIQRYFVQGVQLGALKG
jgi:putative aldouronate transport system permease protein